MLLKRTTMKQFYNNHTCEICRFYLQHTPNKQDGIRGQDPIRNRKKRMFVEQL